MRQCKICGDDFEPKHYKSSFCGKDHFRPCKNCGEEYLVKKVVRPPEFCSGSCGAKYRSKNDLKNKKCELCHEDFLGNASSKYCSKVHRRECKTCHSEFEVVKPSRNVYFCSVRCSRLKNELTKKCKTCEEEFVTRDPSKIYCDRAHFRNCTFCANVFQLKAPNDDARFCSLSCASQSRSYTNQCILCKSFFETKKKDSKFCIKRHSKSCVICSKQYFFDPYQPSTTCSPKCASKTVDFEERNRKSIETLKSRYGVTNSYQIAHVVEAMIESTGTRVSNLNRQWKDKFERELGVDFELEKPFFESCSSYADLKRGDLLIDINPSITHNSTEAFVHLIKRCHDENCSKHLPKSETSHQDRFLLAEANDKRLLQYFDWMDEDIFVSVVRSKLKLDSHRVYARKCDVREVSQRDANRFLRENHLLGAARRQTFCVGLFFDDELVHVNTYGPARLNKNFQWEAIRSCSKRDWHVQGGIQKADSFFMKNRSPESIVSYVDLAISTGSTEAKNPGWRLISTNKPSATWVRVVDSDVMPRFVKDASARRLSADKLLGLKVGEKYPSHHPDGSVFTNDEVLLAEGYLKVFDAGTRTYGWKKGSKDS